MGLGNFVFGDLYRRYVFSRNFSCCLYFIVLCSCLFIFFQCSRPMWQHSCSMSRDTMRPPHQQKIMEMTQSSSLIQLVRKMPKKYLLFDVYIFSLCRNKQYVPSTIYQNSVKKYLATSYFRFLYRSSKIKEKCLNYFKYEIRKYSIETGQKNMNGIAIFYTS